MNKTPVERYSSAPEFFTALCIAAQISPIDVDDRVTLRDISYELDSVPSPSSEGPEISQKPKVMPRVGFFFFGRRWSMRGAIIFGILAFALISVSILFAGMKAESPFHMSRNASTPAPTNTLQALPSLVPESPRFFAGNFNDQFTNNWETFITNSGRNGLNLSVENGSLVFNITDPNLWTYLTYTPETYDNVRIDVRVENRAEDSGVNLICQYNGKEWYEFHIISTGLYWIYYQKLDSDHLHTSPAIIANGGSNKIKTGKSINEYGAICSGTTLSLYINGVMIKTVIDRDHGLNSGNIGFGALSTNRVPVMLAVNQIEVSQP